LREPWSRRVARVPGVGKFSHQVRVRRVRIFGPGMALLQRAIPPFRDETAEGWGTRSFVRRGMGWPRFVQSQVPEAGPGAPGNRRCFDFLHFVEVAQHDSADGGVVLSHPSAMRLRKDGAPVHSCVGEWDGRGSCYPRSQKRDLGHPAPGDFGLMKFHPRSSVTAVPRKRSSKESSSFSSFCSSCLNSR